MPSEMESLRKSRGLLLAGAGAAAGVALLLAWWLNNRKRGAPVVSADEAYMLDVLAVTRDNIATLTKDVVAWEARADAAVGPSVPASGPAAAAPAPAAIPPALTGDRANGYYFFASSGQRVKNKWDSYDVDAELEKLDGDAPASPPLSRAASGSASAPATAPTAAPAAAPPPAATSATVKPASVDPITIRALRTQAGLIDKAIETCLTDLDGASGSSTGASALPPALRAQRKDLVAQLHALLKRVDDRTAALPVV